MPLYEFKCPQCKKTVEQLCKVGQGDKELVCPHCGHRGLQRLISSFAAPGNQDKCANCPGGNCSNC